MRKRMICITMITTFVSLVIMLVASLLVIIQVNNLNNKKQISNYLSFAVSTFTGDNYQETANVLTISNKDIRITFINTSGTVLYDSSITNTLENHLTRPEIKNLNQVYTRKSESLNIKMMYIADLEYNTYIRIAMPISSINNIVTAYVLVGTISSISILIISFLLVLYISKKSLVPVNNSINELLEGVTPDKPSVNSIDELPKVINSIDEAFNNKITEINIEKEKLNAFLNDMNEGMIVLNNNLDLVIINKMALDLFEVEYDKVIGKNYLYLIRNKDLQDIITTKKYSEEYIYSDNDKSYSFSFKSLDKEWLKNGLLITFYDITSKVALEKTKKEFFANASHELKSPLTSIIGYQQLIVCGMASEEEKMEYSKKTIVEASRMNQIIIDMLDLSKYENENNPSLELVSLDNILKECLDSLTGKIKNKHLKVSIDSSNVTLLTEKTYMDQIIRNLIDNAIKYNKDSGSINVILNKEYLEVFDTGLGISESDQKRVFERFYRVDKAKSKTLGGTGLGLAIVKHACQLLGYEILLDSKLDEYTKTTIKFNK